jgi:hypothetical protein
LKAGRQVIHHLQILHKIHSQLLIGDWRKTLWNTLRNHQKEFCIWQSYPSKMKDKWIPSKKNVKGLYCPYRSPSRWNKRTLDSD